MVKSISTYLRIWLIRYVPMTAKPGNKHTRKNLPSFIAHNRINTKSETLNGSVNQAFPKKALEVRTANGKWVNNHTMMM